MSDREQSAESDVKQGSPMNNWPVPCNYCDHIADSHDSLADTRADLAVHVHLTHPGQPLPGTWTIADVRSIPGILAREGRPLPPDVTAP